MMSGSQKTNEVLGGERQTGVFPWHPSRGNQGTDYMQDGQAFPWHPSRGNPGTDYMQDGQAFPWHPSRGNPGTDYMQDNRALSVAFKHRNWLPSILHMASLRSFLSSFKAWQCSKKCSSFSISAEHHKCSSPPSHHHPGQRVCP